MFLNASVSISPLKDTLPASLFGTSIPIAAFPGIGASIRISAAARLSFISSDSDTILLTLTPCSGCSSYLVTAGPQLISVIVTLTPKFCNVCCSRIAVSLFSRDCPALSVPFPLLSRLTGGKTYSCFFLSTLFSIRISSVSSN